jgi:hypothetical protein
VHRLWNEFRPPYGPAPHRTEPGDEDADSFGVSRGLVSRAPVGRWIRLFPLLRLAREIEELVGRPVDVAAVEVMAEPVRERALAEAIPL